MQGGYNLFCSFAYRLHKQELTADTGMGRAQLLTGVYVPLWEHLTLFFTRTANGTPFFFLFFSSFFIIEMPVDFMSHLI